MTAPANTPVITIVLITWNGWALLERCLRSLVETNQNGPEVEVLVVDNGSDDGTAAGIAAFPWVRYMPQQTNLGFVRANNLGVAAGRAELVLILNNDTVVEPQAITALVAAAREHPEFDIFVPEMRCLAAPAIVDNRGIFLDRTGHFRQLDAGAPVSRARPRSEVFGASGGACLVRRDVVRRIGLFDEALEFYLEDCDFAARARATGFRALFVPESRVLHEGSATASREPDRKFFLIQRNMWALWRRWSARAPWRLAWWLGIAYEAFQAMQAARTGRVGLFVRAKRAAGTLGGANGNGRAIVDWVGVRSRPLVDPTSCSSA